MKIRNLLESDAPDVAGLLSQLGYAVSADDIPPRLDKVRDEDGAAYLAVDDDDEALGLVVLVDHWVLHARGPVALIPARVVSPDAGGKGVGRALVHTAKVWARERQCVRLLVTSGEQRADAHAFYPACGLPYTGRRFAVTLT
jgi:GNAT superfamily N-acetyltransferase